MAFELERTTALFGKFNFREEARGKDGRVDAIDVPFTITSGKELLDLIIGYDKDGELLSTHAFDEEDGRPLIPNVKLKAIHKREGLIISIWDPKAKRKKTPFIELKGARIQEPELTMQSPNQVVLDSKIQIAEPDDETFIKFRHLRGMHADIQIIAENMDMFGPPGSEKEGDDNVTPIMKDVVVPDKTTEEPDGD